MSEESKNITHKNKGGRPPKEEKRKELLATKCTYAERTIIRAKAKVAGISVSEYLREMALSGKVDRLKKVLPAEVLQLSATFNHMAANLNQIAKKRNGLDELNALERAELAHLSTVIKALASDIKNHLK